MVWDGVPWIRGDPLAAQGLFEQSLAILRGLKRIWFMALSYRWSGMCSCGTRAVAMGCKALGSSKQSACCHWSHITPCYISSLSAFYHCCIRRSRFCHSLDRRGHADCRDHPRRRPVPLAIIPGTTCSSTTPRKSSVSCWSNNA